VCKLRVGATGSVGQGAAPTSRQDDQSVLASQGGSHRFRLQGPEGCVAPVLAHDSGQASKQRLIQRWRRWRRPQRRGLRVPHCRLLTYCRAVIAHGYLRTRAHHRCNSRRRQRSAELSSEARRLSPKMADAMPRQALAVISAGGVTHKLGRGEMTAAATAAAALASCNPPHCCDQHCHLR
jgi:hypothetical protein